MHEQLLIGTMTTVLAGMVAELEVILLMEVMLLGFELRRLAMDEGVLYGGCDRKVT